MRAVSSGDRDKVESLLRDGADLNPSPSVFKTTPLIVACGTKGSYKIACLLLEEGADPNLGNDEGWTPLMGAAKSGHYRTVGVLLEGGAHPDIHTPKGWTALMEAVDKGHGDIALRIIEAGATPHIQHKVNKTNALLLATEHDKLDRVVHALLDRMDSSSHLDLQNSEGDTALLIAFKKNKVQLVKRLLSMGANPNISNKNGETPVIIAQGEDKREILDLLQSCARPI
ncbi:Ankyrin homolog, partial [Geodia barretti]